MSKINEDVYKNKRALPNKILNEDGSVTDLLGNSVVPTDEAYKKIPALPNKVLNPDGTYSTLSEIIGGSAGKDLFVIVDELPEEGEPNKIYLVPDGEGGFNEYHYIDGKWDPVGAIDMGVGQQVYYWDGKTDQTGLDFWNNVMQINNTTDVLVIVIGRSMSNINHLGLIKVPKNSIRTNKQTDYYNYIVYDRMDAFAKNNSEYNIYSAYIQFTIENDIITQISAPGARALKIPFLATDVDYSTPYEPLYPGSPATKKYVDDSIASAITDAMGGEY